MNLKWQLSCKQEEQMNFMRTQCTKHPIKVGFFHTFDMNSSPIYSSLKERILAIVYSCEPEIQDIL